AGIPDAWLQGEERFADPDAHRAAYARHLGERRDAAHVFLEEAERVRANLV
ncbi:MAG: hypothetical protein RL760_637, partial [Candidatus Eisenbacteria bacterium]